MAGFPVELHHCATELKQKPNKQQQNKTKKKKTLFFSTRLGVEES